MSFKSKLKSYTELEEKHLLSLATAEFKDKTIIDAWSDNCTLWEELAKRGVIFKFFSENDFLRNKVPLPWNFMSDSVLTNYISSSYSGRKVSDVNSTFPHVYKIASQRGLISELIKRNVWVKEPLESQYRLKKVKDNAEFESLIAKDKTIRNLAGAALLLNGEAGTVEEVIMEIYGGRFKGQLQLHQYLQDNRDKIIELVSNGLTNLGAFIGEFSLSSRSILPVLIGEAFDGIESERLPNSLEKKLIRSLQTVYSPRFNKNQSEVMTELELKIVSTKGRVQSLYRGLIEHYQEVVRLGGKLL